MLDALADGLMRLFPNRVVRLAALVLLAATLAVVTYVGTAVKIARWL